MKKIIITILMFLTFTPNVFGVIFGNDSCNAFKPGCLPPPGGLNMSTSTDIITSVSLGQLIADGAGYYLSSDSAFLSLLQKVESQSTGIDSLYMVALKNISLAESVYYDLVIAVENMEYNKVVLEKLRAFDYEGFQLKKGLNPAVFATVVKYLVNGNVKEVYAKFYNDTAEIHNLLENLKLVPGMETNELEKLWRINQKYFETLLFGQYVTEVFMAIK